MTRPFDLSVYLVADPAICARGIEQTVRESLAGGVTMVQLRDPDSPIRAIVEIARALRPILASANVPFIVNDCVHVALAAGADGVHLGQGDMDPLDARALLGPDAIIGLSVGNLAEFAASREALPAVDYLGVGPFRATGTKPDAGAAIGAEGFAAVRAATALPMVAIGGMDASSAPEAIRAGADGVAVVSAICGADDPASAARAIAAAVAMSGHATPR